MKSRHKFDNRITRIIRGPVKPYYIRNEFKTYVHEELEKVNAVMDRGDSVCLVFDTVTKKICGLPSNDRRSHLIPNAPVLSQLAGSSRKVIELNWNVSGWKQIFQRGSKDEPVRLLDPSQFEPQNTALEVSINDATTGHFACNKHDHSVFDLADTSTIDIGNKKQQFLFVYRVVLYVYIQIQRSLAPFSELRIRQLLRNSDKSIRMYAFRLQYTAKNILTNDTILSIGSMLEQDHSQLPISIHRYDFRSSIRFAAATMLDIKKALFVFPSADDCHSMFIIQLDETSRSKFEPDTTDNSDLRVLRQIMKDSYGSVVISPDSYVDSTPAEKNAIQQILLESSNAEFLQQIFDAKKT